MTEGWTPVNALEHGLLAASERGDVEACSALLCESELVLPLVEGASNGGVPWAVVERDDGPFLTAFTSPNVLAEAVRPREVPHLPVHYRALVADWPDHGWGLVLNPSQPLEAWFDAGQVARMAAPEVADPRGPGGPVVLEQVLTPGLLTMYLKHGETRAMGYAYRLADRAGLRTPAELIRGLALDGSGSDVSVRDAAAYLLRWPAVGPPLYRSPFGGTDEGRMRSVNGWVVEPQPFVGTGFVPSRLVVIREYRVGPVRLPHGAEIVRLLPSAEEEVVAVFDADRTAWLLTTPARSGTGAADADEPVL